MQTWSNGSREPHPVTHTLTVQNLDTPQDELHINQALAMMDGVLHAEANWLRSQVTLTYDIYRLHITDLEQKLADLGFAPDDHLLSRVRLEMIHFTERNELDNLTYQPRVLNEPPAASHH